MRKLFYQMCFFVLLVGSLNLSAAEVRLISVTGMAEKNFAPDIVRLNVSVWGKGNSAKSAQLNNQTNFEALVKSVAAYKVKKEDIATITYELNPEYVFNQKTQMNKVVGYMVNQNLSLTLRNVSEAAPFIDSLVSLSSPKPLEGGININSLSFDLDKRAQEERALLSEAVKSAEGQAEILSQAAHVKLKGIYRLAPRSANGPQAQEFSLMTREKRASGGATQLMSGEVKVSAEVSAEYLIE